MSLGFKVNYDIRRPDKKLVEQFKGLPVANIADEMSRMNCVESAIVPFNKNAFVGTAFTVKAPDADNLMFHKALDLAQPGDVIVVTCIGNSDRAICGEIMMRYAQAKGIVGFLIDGMIRDVEGAAELEHFAVYARGVTPLGPYKNGPGEINVPIAFGRQVVCPGDIVCGDADGIVIIKPEEAEEALALGRKHLADENRTMASIAAGQGMGHAWVDEILKARNCDM